ncbi:hypothetical protein FSP39_020797 [Pinctada imbricata]|uniref:SWIM-type domain-containing protein n=1 Tax=Pinctada imbricata TaxID=66713 RepID=A0AA88YUD4_PINIB|nr:hypothetical protein FSP39_020797 [Pinctada imbricata]
MQKRMEESKYGSYTIPQLKEELRKRNARLTGRKRELVERLIVYDRNSNFGKQEITEPEYSMSLPKSETYFDVNSDSHFSGLNMETLNTYLEHFDKKFDSHVSQLYNEKFLRYDRISQQSDKTFIKASCRAETRKGVSYTVDIELGQRCSIIEPQCECAAGMGPHAHCKHVCCALYGAVMYQSKRDIKTEETCTQQLQNFHKCKKKNTGSPLKLNNLDLAGADEFTNRNFDPRPERFRNSKGYLDHFRNECLNFPGASKMPIYQIFDPSKTVI